MDLVTHSSRWLKKEKQRATWSQHLYWIHILYERHIYCQCCGKEVIANSHRNAVFFPHFCLVLIFKVYHRNIIQHDFEAFVLLLLFGYWWLFYSVCHILVKYDWLFRQWLIWDKSMQRTAQMICTALSITLYVGKKCALSSFELYCVNSLFRRCCWVMLYKKCQTRANLFFFLKGFKPCLSSYLYIYRTHT